MGKKPAIRERVCIRLAACEASVHCIVVLMAIRLVASVAWLNWFMLRGPRVWLKSLAWVRTARGKGVA